MAGAESACSPQGRPTEQISLPKPVSGGLGFSVVGLGPDGVGGSGVFIRQVQPGSIAHRSVVPAGASPSLLPMLLAALFSCLFFFSFHQILRMRS